MQMHMHESFYVYPGSRDVLWSLVCVVCSTVSKEQGITVVAVCVVYDLFIANQVYTSTCIYYYVTYYVHVHVHVVYVYTCMAMRIHLGLVHNIS